MNSWKHSMLRMPSSSTTRGPQAGQRCSWARSGLDTVSSSQMASRQGPSFSSYCRASPRRTPSDVAAGVSIRRFACTRETPASSQPSISSTASATAFSNVCSTSSSDRSDRAMAESWLTKCSVSTSSACHLLRRRPFHVQYAQGWFGDEAGDLPRDVRISSTRAQN
uniref:Uncharacterized protein n=1 Tax=uncultured Nocardioidaceae bacterium TaxID=253824 RepID=A0A6J4MAN6_9ACTN|nr:MAG: hypothetical protein AVDCRST_MAG46-2784 [uncultured Nocardioidaceae bacterium]